MNEASMLSSGEVNLDTAAGVAPTEPAHRVSHVQRDNRFDTAAPVSRPEAPPPTEAPGDDVIVDRQRLARLEELFQYRDAAQQSSQRATRLEAAARAGEAVSDGLDRLSVEVRRAVPDVVPPETRREIQVRLDGVHAALRETVGTLLRQGEGGPADLSYAFARSLRYAVDGLYDLDLSTPEGALHARDRINGALHTVARERSAIEAARSAVSQQAAQTDAQAGPVDPNAPRTSDAARQLAAELALVIRSQSGDAALATGTGAAIGALGILVGG